MSGGVTLGEIPGLTICLTILCGIAVLFNSAVIIVLLKKLNTFSTVDVFIINLCVSDVLLAGIGLPARLNNPSHEEESFAGGNVLST